MMVMAESGNVSKVGRPLSYTVEKGDIVCDAIEAGKGFRYIEETHGINAHAIYRWLDGVEEFRQRYASARQNQAHSFVERIDQLTDQMLNREITTEQCRVAIDALKWTASKRLATVYGDKLQTENSTKITVQVEYGSSPSLPSGIIDAEIVDTE